MKKNHHVRNLGVIAAFLLASACGKDKGFLYYYPSKEPDVRLTVNVREIRSAGGVDILWVIDNSGSMTAHQRSVISNTNLFMADFLKNKISWKMGLVSTDTSENPYIGFQSVFDSTHPDPTSAFQTAVGDLGTSGSGTEKTFEPILQHLTRYPNFLRSNIPLAVLIVTDATEQSSMDAPTFLQSFQGIVGNRPVFVYPVLAATDLANGARCESDQSDYDYAGSPYEAFAKAAKISQAYSICDVNFGTNLAKIGQQITEEVLRSEIRLAQRPKPRSLRVLFHGKPLQGGPRESGGYWYYDYERNLIVFHTLDFAQGDLEKVTIEFEQDDGMPFASALNDEPWVEYNLTYESPHNYPRGGFSKPPIVIEGAKKLKLYFSRVKTEKNYDNVIVKDGSGREIQKFSGDIPQGFWTLEIPGDRCSVSMTTDTSVEDWGFAVTKVAALF